MSQRWTRPPEALLSASNPIIYAGQGVMYAEASEDLVELAELLQIPVTTSMAGKSGFPEKHPLSLGSSSGVMNGAAYRFMGRADVVFAAGSSLTRHGMTTNIPSDKTFIQATNDPIDIGKNYDVEYPLLGDAKLIIRQMIEACRDPPWRRVERRRDSRGDRIGASGVARPVGAQAEL